MLRSHGGNAHKGRRGMTLSTPVAPGVQPRSKANFPNIWPRSQHCTSHQASQSNWLKSFCLQTFKGPQSTTEHPHHPFPPTEHHPPPIVPHRSIQPPPSHPVRLTASALGDLRCWLFHLLALTGGVLVAGTGGNAKAILLNTVPVKSRGSEGMEGKGGGTGLILT